MPADVVHEHLWEGAINVSAGFGTVVFALRITMGTLIFKLVVQLHVDISHTSHNFVRLHFGAMVKKFVCVENLHEVVQMLMLT